MISLQSINNKIVPNVYVKKVILDSTNIPSENKGSVLLSIKLKKSSNTTDDLEKLLNSELKPYLKFHVHFITNEEAYKQIIKNPDPGVLSKTDGQSKACQVDDFEINNNSETVLDNGQILMELTKNISFDFKEKDNFLAIVAVSMIKHPGLEKSFLGDMTADVVIYNNQVQNEGMIFTIAGPKTVPMKTAAAEQMYKKFGAPGEIWAGGVHVHNNLFMAGSQHSKEPHPYLDYEMVPIYKYQDNRIKKKIEREMINITEVTTKLRSLTKFTSATNNLNFDKDQSEAYISDIFLSQNKDLDVQGSFMIDKNSIVKNECAMPFLFSNIKKKYKGTGLVLKSMINGLLSESRLLFLNIYEGDTLLGTLTSDNENGAVFRERAPDPRQTKGRPKTTLVLKIDKEDFKAKKVDGVTSYVFKRHFGTSSDRTLLKYKVTAEYSDPTIPYVRSIVPFITSAIEQINQIVKEAETFNAFDPYTKKLKSWFTKHLKENTSD